MTKGGLTPVWFLPKGTLMPKLTLEKESERVINKGLGGEGGKERKKQRERGVSPKGMN